MEMVLHRFLLPVSAGGIEVEKQRRVTAAQQNAVVLIDFLAPGFNGRFKPFANTAQCGLQQLGYLRPERCPQSGIVAGQSVCREYQNKRSGFHGGYLR